MFPHLSRQPRSVTTSGGSGGCCAEARVEGCRSTNAASAMTSRCAVVAIIVALWLCLDSSESQKCVLQIERGVTFGWGFLARRYQFIAKSDSASSRLVGPLRSQGVQCHDAV